MNNSELTKYINKSINNIITEVAANTLNNPKETAFLLKYMKNSNKLMKIRLSYEEKNQHIPAFLISSITNSCNLYCRGCYARNNGICCEHGERELLSSDKWQDIFTEALGLGIGFNLLAGGEPLIRRDVIEKAAQMRDIIFPIFTNGTLIDENYCELFDKNRNLIPVLSIEGTKSATDKRRGEGIYEKLLDKMNMMKINKILFGASVTVTTENLSETTSESFIKLLLSYGCRVIFFIEYVPVDNATSYLAFSEKERIELSECQNKLRDKFKSILFLSFPGDEKNMGGCLAAGRGFFHINPYGEAEACPFSPHSDRNLVEFSMIDVLQSPFFNHLQDEGLVGGEHDGGCALFEHESEVKSILGIAD